MEVTQKAIILDRYKNNNGQKTCMIFDGFHYYKCAMLIDETPFICGYCGDELEQFEDSDEIKPCENCPLWGED